MMARFNIKFYRLILGSFILLILMFSITAISAADLNDTDVSQDIPTEEKSFSDLNSKINSSDSNFTLESDYSFDMESDRNFSSGIKIDKNDFIIEGNNHTVDCKNQARAFHITGKTVQINNLIIKNAFYGPGSAIATNSSLTLNNVTFINCIGNNKTSDCGAVYIYKNTLNVNDCRFIDNCGKNGASITSIQSTVSVVNSTFISSSANIIKGQIYLEGSKLTVANSNFLNSTSKYSTAIFSVERGNIEITNSKFKNLRASKTAGAIGVKMVTNMMISNCTFDNVSSANNGGAIFADINGAMFFNVIINNTTFNNCHSDFGGAILQLDGTLTIVNSNFTYNEANYEGGAIYTSHTGVEITNSTFKFNRLLDEISYGGACYFDKGYAELNGNIFENNIGFEVSTIYGYDTKLELKDNYFNNPSDAISIYTVYGKVIRDDGNNYTDDEKSFNNTNYFYNFENTANPFVIINNTLYFDAMPEKFDLRDYGWVTPVKSQGFMGSCCVFGNLAALESSLLRYANKTYSLSVNNAQNTMLKYSKYGIDDAIEGGLTVTSSTYLIDWLGIFPEEYDSYDELGKISSLFITPEDIHIQNVVIIPPRANTSDNNPIKNALINYGAVSTSIHADFSSNYFNKSSSAQYYTGTKKSNHGICVVGWDDTYSRYNFINTPPGDGAWICKNSWGTEWGDSGYLYVSYYDASFADRENVCYIINNDSYTRIYQFDVGGNGKWLEKNTPVYYTNIFTADEDELIGAVGTFFNQSGVDYEFSISVNNVSVYTQNGKSEFGGYATIKLNKLIQIRKGDIFKITFKNSRMYYATDLRIRAQYGQSFGSNDGKNWSDMATYNLVAVLKAYGVRDLNITQNLVKFYEDKTPFTAKINAGEKVTFEIDENKYEVKADSNGLAKLEIDYKPGNYTVTTTYNNIAIVNYIIIKNNTIISQDVVRGYGSDYDYKLQVLNSTGHGLNRTNVTVSINGISKIYESDEFGYITIPFKKLTSSQKITVTNPQTGEVKTTTINVVSRFSGAGNVVMYYFDGTQFKVKIIGDNGNAVGKSQVVTIKLNKKTYKVKTNAHGFITFKIPKTVKPGSYKLTATYNGETIKKTVKVKQNLKTKKYNVKKSAKKLIIKATLKNGKKAVKNKKIILKLNGKKFTAKTNKNGIAKFTIKKKFIKKLKKGKKYTMKVTYLKNTIKTTLKVKG